MYSRINHNRNNNKFLWFISGLFSVLTIFLGVISGVIGITVDFEPFKEKIFPPVLINSVILNDPNDHSFRSTIKELTIDDIKLEYRNSKHNMKTYIKNISADDEESKDLAIKSINHVIEKEDNLQTKSSLQTLKGKNWFEEAKKQYENNKLDAKKKLEKARKTLEKALEIDKSNKHAKYYLLKTCQMIQQFIINNASPEKDLPKKDLKYLQKLNSKIKNLKQSLILSNKFSYRWEIDYGWEIDDQNNMETVDFIFTTAQTSLEFLIPSILDASKIARFHTDQGHIRKETEYVYIADSGNNISKVDSGNDGSGVPDGIETENLNIADTNNHRIRKFAVSVLNPHAKDIYIADSNNHISVLNCDVGDSYVVSETIETENLYIADTWYNDGDGDGDTFAVSVLNPHAKDIYIADSSLDASKICRYSCKLIDPCCNEIVASDITRNGTILSLDASQIATNIRDIYSYNWTVTQKRILSIGIDKYYGKFEQLKFAVSDAIKISEAFNKYGFTPSTLKNKAAVKSNILNELSYEVLISKPGDTFVLYIAGHGFSDINGDLFVVPYSNGKRYPVISLSEINSILSYHKGKTYALIDTCFDRKEVDLNSYIQNLSVGIKDNQTTFILASNTKAIESSSFKSGLMTYSILKYLEGSAGNWTAGYSGDQEDAIEAQLNSLHGIAAFRNVYYRLQEGRDRLGEVAVQDMKNTTHGSGDPKGKETEILYISGSRNNECDVDDSRFSQLNMKKRILSIGIDKYNGSFYKTARDFSLDTRKTYYYRVRATAPLVKNTDVNCDGIVDIIEFSPISVRFKKIAGDVNPHDRVSANTTYFYWVSAKNRVDRDRLSKLHNVRCDSNPVNTVTSNERRILSIGIDQYNGKFEQLKFAVSDAIKTSKAFNKYGYESSTLTNDAADKSNILDELFHEILVSKPDDNFVLYIAGHGFSDINGNLFVVPYSNGKRYSIISLSEINSLLSFHKGKTYALIDTCFDRKEIDLNSYVQSFPVRKNGNETTFILASNTKAIESKFFKSGLMTHSILKFLANADVNCESEVDIFDIVVRDYEQINFQKMFSYISRNTKKISLSNFQYNQSPLNLNGSWLLGKQNNKRAEDLGELNATDVGI